MRLRAASAAAVMAVSVLGLAATASGPAGAGAWPGANGKVIFKSGVDELWVVNADGSGLSQLTPGSSDPECSTADEEPEWSPDGSKIVFTRTTDTGQDVWTMDADGSNQKQLTFDGDSACNEISFSEHPSFAPDGTKIVFANGSNDDSIWTMDPDGGNPTLLPTASLVDNGQPNWQPIVAPPPAPAGTAQPSPAVVITPRFTG